MAADLNTELVQTLILNLDETFERLPEWRMLSMIIDLDGKRFAGTHGYVYAADGTPTPTSCSGFTLKKTVTAFLESKYSGNAEYPVAVLVQYDKVSGRYAFTFEDTDKSRWKVNPLNFKEMPEKVRPNFDE